MRKVILTFCVLITASGFVFAQRSKEQAELIWIKQKANIDMAITKNRSLKQQYNKFTEYNWQLITENRIKFISQYSAGKLDSAGVVKFFAGLKNILSTSFANFQPFFKSNPDKVNNAIKEVKRVTGTCSAPVNLDFSNGNLSGWSAFYAINNSNSSFNISGITGGPCGPVKAAANDVSVASSLSIPTDYQVEIDSAGAVDPILDTLMPVVPPGAKYSCRVGDSTIPYQGVAEITNQFVLPDSTPVINCSFAYLLENPNHVFYQQPFMCIGVLDSVGNTIAAYRFVIQSGILPGIYFAPDLDTVYYQTWKTVSIALPKYQGHCVTLVYQVADCSLGGHFGYAYVSTSLGRSAVTTTFPAFCGQSDYRLTAPVTSNIYQWSGPCVSGPNNLQSVQITCGGTYTLVIQDSAHTYSDTMYAFVPTVPGPAPMPSFMADTVCSGTPTLFTNTSSPDSSSSSFFWDFADSGYYMNIPGNPSWTFSTPGIHLVHLIETVRGCSADTVIPVLDTVCTTGIQNITHNAAITISPNPSNGIFIVEQGALGAGTMIEVYNILGQNICTHSCSDAHTVLNLSNHPPGVYFYRIVSDRGQLIASGKLIKD